MIIFRRRAQIYFCLCRIININTNIRFHSNRINSREIWNSELPICKARPFVRHFVLQLHRFYPGKMLCVAAIFYPYFVIRIKLNTMCFQCSVRSNNNFKPEHFFIENQRQRHLSRDFFFLSVFSIWTRKATRDNIARINHENDNRVKI